jgi:hypothetical protein
MTIDIEAASDAQIEAAITEVTSPLLVQLNLSANEKLRLARVAQDSNLSESAYILGLVQEQLNQRIGAPTITSASAYAQKISGPSGSVSRG